MDRRIFHYKRECLALLSAMTVISMVAWFLSYNTVLTSTYWPPAVQPLPDKREMTSCLVDDVLPGKNQTSQEEVPSEIPPPGRREHPLCPNLKRRYFPHFSYPPVTPRQWVTDKDTTNATYSRFTIVNFKNSYSVCDELELVIEARNGYGEPKTYGGDLFTAKIFTQNGPFKAGSGTDGEVLDLGNGNYSAFFTLKWPGTVHINVTLVTPSEGVYELQVFRETLQPRENYVGTFSKKIDGQKNPLEETVRCGPVPIGRLASMCNLSNPRVGLEWYCKKPNSSHLSCADWTRTRTLELEYSKEIEDRGYSKRSSVVHRPTVPVMGSPDQVTVNDKSAGLIKERLDRLPLCGQQPEYDRLQVIPWVSGFYQNNQWYPPTCKLNRFKKGSKERLECLSNKTFYFYGDSTIRHVYGLMGVRIGANFEATGHWVNVADTFEPKHGIHFHYICHNIPIRTFKWYNLRSLRFVADELDRIGSNETAVVLISLWAHFQPLPRSFYEMRMKAIAESAQRLLTRNPKAFVMFKGGNTQSNYGPRIQYLNDHYARDNEEALRRILKSYPKIHFLDAWGMSKSQLTKPNTHPPAVPHISSLIDHILTIVCPK